jgi:hypothetical protein
LKISTGKGGFFMALTTIYKPKRVLDCAALLNNSLIMESELDAHWVIVSVLDTEKSPVEIVMDFADRSKSPLSSLKSIRRMEERGINTPTHWIGTADLIHHDGQFLTPTLQGLKLITVIE